MNTITTARIGAFSTGRMTTRSIDDAEHEGADDREREGGPVRHAGLDQRPGEVGREHRHLALREIHQVGRLVDHHQRQRDAGVDAAGGEAGEDLVQEEVHRARAQ